MVEKIRRATYDSVSRLKNYLHRTELIPRPVFADVRAIWQIGGLEAHRKGPNSNSQFFVEIDVQFHAGIQVCRSIVEVVEHIVRQFGESELVGVSNRLLVRLLQIEMVESNSQRLDANG